MMVALEAEPKKNIQLPAEVYTGNLPGQLHSQPSCCPLLGHTVWPLVGKGRFGGELVERSGGIVKSRCPPFPTLSLFLGQPINFTDLFDLFNRFAQAEQDPAVSVFLDVCIKYDVYQVSLEIINEEKENKRTLLSLVWFDQQHLEMAQELCPA